MSFFQFEGAPCLQHTNYVFYKAFRYKCDDQSKILAVGDFFFLKILQEIPVCIGEIELLWEDKASNQLFASLKLYFRPEHTPDGRQDDTGEDEVIALGERLVLRLDDLTPLIQHDIKWSYGSTISCSKNSSSGNIVQFNKNNSSNKPAETNGNSIKNGADTPSVGGCEKVKKDEEEGESEEKVKKEGGEENGEAVKQKDGGGDGVEKVKKEGGENGGNNKTGCEDIKNGLGLLEENGKKRNCTVALVKLENMEPERDQVTSGAANLAVMNYPRYCRYRAMRKRLEGCENEWLHLAVVVAIGGYSGRSPGCRVMFCRDTFYQSEIDDLDIRMDHMLPVLKGKTKGKKSKQLNRKDSLHDSDSMEEMFANVTPSISTSSRPRRSTESAEISEDKVSTEEQAFLIGLHKFMHEAKMPIGRIPSLGFKQIDLFYFYKQAEKLGGYDSITHKRMWKHLYDKLGGNSSNTSAATCTRKHYERLLLPYERHLRKVKLSKQKKKLHKFGSDELDIKSESKDDNSGSNQKENVEVPEKKEIKAEEKDVHVVVESDVKNDIKSSHISNDKDKMTAGSMEHSKPDLQGDSEVLEIPMVRHRMHGGSAFPAPDSKALESGANLLNLPFPPMDQLHHHQQQALKSSSLAPGLPGGENAGLSYPNMVYRAGYLVPVIPPHMLQTPWGIIAPPSSSSSSSSASTSTPHIKAEGSASQAGTNFKDPSTSSILSSSRTNQSIGPGSATHSDSRSKSSTGKGHHSSYQLPTPSGSSALKAAHTNTPYKPSPYLLNDHIQPGRKNFHSSQHFRSNDLLANSSQNLAPILHPTPPGHRSQRHLPPAPLAVYLHPSSTNPFSPLQSPNTSSPPAAHNHPRKRPYPFDNPTNPPSVAFPSPDLVLDRIRNSTGLPRNNAASMNSSSIRQRFDDPRQIFRQTPQSFGASPNAAPSQRKESSHQQEMMNSKQSSSKSKIPGRKPQQPPYPAFGHLSSLELQQALLQQGHSMHSSSTKVMDQMKSASNSNGLLSSQQSSKGLVSSQQSSPLPSSSKDGRLTSALFGTQFTALPRTSKPSELPSPHSVLTDTSSAAAAAMSLNPHLHPAFMSPYLPSGVATTAASAMSPQLQMLAGAYATSPAQLVAYEEMLRQNGYGAFLAGSNQQAKGAKKN